MSESIEAIGKCIDKAFDSSDTALLERCVDDANSLERSESLGLDDQAVLQYYLGNAWSDLDILKNVGTVSTWYYKREEHIKAIKCFVSAR
jgi:hypothetical protein